MSLFLGGGGGTPPRAPASSPRTSIPNSFGTGGRRSRWCPWGSQWGDLPFISAELALELFGLMAVFYIVSSLLLRRYHGGEHFW